MNKPDSVASSKEASVGDAPKEFTLPVSDCGCFIAGEIGPDCFDPTRFGGSKPYPSFGVIVWYEDREIAKAAFQAATGAHFK